MSKDKYDEYYLTLTQAKNLEKRGLEAQALEVYLQITEKYLPDTDFAFERAVLMLEKRENLETAISICRLALKRIKEDEMRGKPEFYLARLEKLEEKKSAKKVQEKGAPLDLPAYFKRHSFIAIATAYVLVSALLCFPDKFAKFAFLIFFAITLVFVVEIVKQVQRNVSIKRSSIILLVSLIGTLASASLVPPPDWTNFFSLEGFYKSSGQTALEETTTATTAEPEAEISTDDLDKLKLLLDKDLIIEDYDLAIDGKRLNLVVYLAPAVGKEEAKRAITGLLTELNAIKGFSRADEATGKLGDLYKQVSASIDVYDSFGVLMLRGELNRASQKISWR